MILSSIHKFLKLEALGGFLLITAAVFALLLANSPWGSLYAGFLQLPVEIRVGALAIAKPLILWINDGLMAVFFFLVGLEIKREFLIGELSGLRNVILPASAAVGGIGVPAVIYLLINLESPQNLNGWAIPTATDIAFALGVLAVLKSRIPLSLKVLLTAIAIMDDLGAIIIIGVFYTEQLSTGVLYVSLVFIGGLVLLNRLNVHRLAPYVLLGIALWICVLKSGVHATLAGVITAFTIPLGEPDDGSESLLERLEHNLHPWVAYGILPLFAFSNAGIPLYGLNLQSFIEPVKLGISVGLFVGKQLGVFAMLGLCLLSGISPMPKGATWLQLYGIALLSGIGFTMSLFIGSLAFEQSGFDAPIRLGVLTGSLASALCGYLVLRYAPSLEQKTKIIDRKKSNDSRERLMAMKQ